MAFGTMTALIYVHMQTQIVDLAYKGKAKEKHVHELLDNNGALTHQILALKSASHLGREFLDKDKGLQFMGQDKVMTFSGPKPKQKMESRGWSLLSFLER